MKKPFQVGIALKIETGHAEIFMIEKKAMQVTSGLAKACTPLAAALFWPRIFVVRRRR